MPKFVIVTEFAVLTEGETCFHAENLPESDVKEYDRNGDWVTVRFSNGAYVDIPAAQIKYIVIN